MEVLRSGLWGRALEVSRFGPLKAFGDVRSHRLVRRESFGGVTVWLGGRAVEVSRSGLWGWRGRAFGGVTAWFPSVIPMTGSQRSKIGRSLKLGRFGAIHSSNNYMRMSYTGRSLSWVFS